MENLYAEQKSPYSSSSKLYEQHEENDSPINSFMVCTYTVRYYLLTRLFKNRKCPEAKNSLGWYLVMILPNLSHFESLTKRCLALRNRPFRPFCDSQHQTEIFLNAQHLFLSESKWLKFGTSITE